MNEFAFLILNALVPVFVTLLAYYSTRYVNILKSKEELAKALIVVDMVVRAVEQAWKNISGEDKKRIALKHLSKLNISIAEEQLDLLIESSVYQLNKNKG